MPEAPGRDDLAYANSDLDQIIAASDRPPSSSASSFPLRAWKVEPSARARGAIRALEPMIRRLLDADVVFDFRLDRHVPRVFDGQNPARADSDESDHQAQRCDARRGP